jgi:hypothetical protein
MTLKVTAVSEPGRPACAETRRDQVAQQRVAQLASVSIGDV